MEERPLGAEGIWIVPYAELVLGYILIGFLQLPLEFIQSRPGKGSFLRNRLMWLGFCIPVFIFTLNGLREIAPAIPTLRLNGRFSSSERILQHFSVY